MLILASKSPRRSEILANAGISFTVRTADVPELRLDSESAGSYVRRLAREKALAIERRPDDVVLAADTVVVVDGDVLEKPVDDQDARRMLQRLSGRQHEVITGFCLVTSGAEVLDAESTLVRFVPLSGDQITTYVATGEPRDKAGAYAIQGQASKFIDRIEGDYFNVVGLPIARVYQHLRRLCNWL